MWLFGYNAIRINRNIDTFPWHYINAINNGCQLATIGSEAERVAIQTALTAAALPAAGNSRGLAIAYVGLLRPASSANPTSGTATGGWMWTDMCTPYTTNYFIAPEPNNDASRAPQSTAAMVYTEFSGRTVGNLVDIEAGGAFPAVYECCIEEPSSSSSKKSKMSMSKKSSSRRHL